MSFSDSIALHLAGAKRCSLGRTLARLPFARKLILAFAVAIGVPLVGYAFVVDSLTRVRLDAIDESALRQSLLVAEQHVEAQGVELLYETTMGAADRQLGQACFAGSHADEESCLRQYAQDHQISAAALVYDGSDASPVLSGEDLALNAAIASAPWVQTAAQGRAAWGILPYKTELTLVAAAPVLVSGSVLPGHVFAVGRRLRAAELEDYLGLASCRASVRSLSAQETQRHVKPRGPAGPSGFAHTGLDVRILRNGVQAQSVLYGLAREAPAALVSVSMNRSALPGRGPSYGIAALCAFACALLLGALLTSLVSAWVARPLAELRVRAEALAEGRRDTRPVEVLTDDALGRVGSAFNYMMANLDQAQRQVLHSERLAMAGKMAASIAHEVRNVLSPIQLRAEMLLQGVQDPLARESLHGMRDEIRRSTALLRSLLDFARSDTETFRPVVVSDVLQKVITLVGPQARKAAVRFSLQDSTTDCRVWGDQAELLQMCVNLLNNALEAGAKNVTLAAETRSDSVRLVVADDGPGMDETTRDHALEPFYTTKPAGQGTGLGLSICQSVVNGHGGTIVVESTKDVGTRMVVTLPILEINGAHPSSGY
ncbi:HAMP domain-containing histidine kinase [bacterium]|nr:HAMP domain-containing histidine kinase [bacterium]